MLGKMRKNSSDSRTPLKFKKNIVSLPDVSKPVPQVSNVYYMLLANRQAIANFRGYNFRRIHLNSTAPIKHNEFSDIQHLQERFQWVDNTYLQAAFQASPFSRSDRPSLIVEESGGLARNELKLMTLREIINRADQLAIDITATNIIPLQFILKDKLANRVDIISSIHQDLETLLGISSNGDVRRRMEEISDVLTLFNALLLHVFEQSTHTLSHNIRYSVRSEEFQEFQQEIDYIASQCINTTVALEDIISTHILAKRSWKQKKLFQSEKELIEQTITRTFAQIESYKDSLCKQSNNNHIDEQVQFDGVMTRVIAKDEPTTISGNASENNGLQLYYRNLVTHEVVRRGTGIMTSHAIRISYEFPDHKVALQTMGSTDIELWDLVSGGTFQCLKGNTENTHCMHYCRDDCFLASDGCHSIRMWNIITGVCLQVFQSVISGHHLSSMAVPISDFAVFPVEPTTDNNTVTHRESRVNGLLAAVFGSDSLSLFDLYTGELLHDFERFRGFVTHMIPVSLSTGYFAYISDYYDENDAKASPTSDDEIARIVVVARWDTETQSIHRLYHKVNDTLFHMQYVPAKNLLLICLNYGHIDCYDIASASILFQYAPELRLERQVPTEKVFSIQSSDDIIRIFEYDIEGNLHVISLGQSDEDIKTPLMEGYSLTGHNSKIVRHKVMTGDSCRVLTVNENKQITVWDIVKCEMLLHFQYDSLSDGRSENDIVNNNVISNIVEDGQEYAIYFR